MSLAFLQSVSDSAWGARPSHPSHEYKLYFDVHMVYNAAEAACGTQGGALASITSIEENNFISGRCFRLILIAILHVDKYMLML